MHPSDPAAVPPPEWAQKMVFAAFGDPRFDWASLDDHARLLASVREGAVAELSSIFLAKWAKHGAEFSAESVMRDAVDAVLHTPPSGGAG